MEFSQQSIVSDLNHHPVLKPVKVVLSNSVWTILTYSTECCENLLVETDFFCHFSGLVLCNEKRLQFNKNKKNQYVGSQPRKSSIPLRCTFLIDVFVGFRSRCTKKSLYDDSIVVFDGFWIKNIFHTNNSCIKVFNSEKIWRDNFSYLLLLDRYPCHNGVQVLGRWCSNPAKNPKRHYTLSLLSYVSMLDPSVVPPY